MNGTEYIQTTVNQNQFYWPRMCTDRRNLTVVFHCSQYTYAGIDKTAGKKDNNADKIKNKSLMTNSINKNSEENHNIAAENLKQCCTDKEIVLSKLFSSL